MFRALPCLPRTAEDARSARRAGAAPVLYRTDDHRPRRAFCGHLQNGSPGGIPLRSHARRTIGRSPPQGDFGGVRKMRQVAALLLLIATTASIASPETETA